MSMSSTRLRDAIKTALDSRFGALTGQGDTDRLGFCADVAQAIVTEITANGVARVSAGGLQREVNNVGAIVATTAPATPQDIPLV